MLAFYSDDPSSNPAEAYSFSVILCLKRTKKFLMIFRLSASSIIEGSNKVCASDGCHFVITSTTVPCKEVDTKEIDCDQMARLFLQYLAIYNDTNLRPIASKVLLMFVHFPNRY